MHIVVRKAFNAGKIIYLYDSFEEDIKDKNNQHIASFSYEKVVYPLSAWIWLVGAFFTTIIFLPIYYGEFNSDVMAAFIYSSIIPIIWIIYSTYENRKVKKYITRIENEINTKKQNHVESP